MITKIVSYVGLTIASNSCKALLGTFALLSSDKLPTSYEAPADEEP